MNPVSAPSEPLAPASVHHVCIRPGQSWLRLGLAEMWHYRELLGFLALRDIKLRYKQTLLGVAWAVIQPLFTMVVFWIFFGRLGNMATDEVPYPLFVLAGLLPWQLFAHALTQSSNSLVAEQNLLTKVYFPRLIVPAASVLGGLADFLVAFVLTLGMMGIFAASGTFPFTLSLRLLLVPVIIAFAILTALSVGLWLASLNVKYRDVRYTIPFITQIWLFITPVIYPVSRVPEQFQILYGLNPMAGVVECFRWTLLGTAAPSIWLAGASVLMVVLLLIGGVFYFRRVERSFADIV